MAKESDIRKVEKFLKKSVEWLKSQDSGCCEMDCPGVEGDLKVVVGWSGGYYDYDDTVIHSKSEPSFAINAAIKINAGYMETDFDMDYNFLYFEDGDTCDVSVSIDPDEDYRATAEYLLDEAEALDKFEYEEDGKIIGHKKFYRMSEDIAGLFNEDACEEFKQQVFAEYLSDNLDKDEVEKLLNDLEEHRKTLEDDSDE